jgi:hypothetical protein
MITPAIEKAKSWIRVITYTNQPGTGNCAFPNSNASAMRLNVIQSDNPALLAIALMSGIILQAIA